MYEQQWENRKKLAENIVEGPQVDQKMALALNSLEKFVKSEIPETSGWKEYQNEKNKQIPSWIPNWTINENIVNHGELHEMVEDVLQTGQLKKPRNSFVRKEMVVVGESGPRLETFIPPPVEVLQLTLEETFFLSSALNKLAVFDEKNKQMAPGEMWIRFQSAEKRFIFK